MLGTLGGFDGQVLQGWNEKNLGTNAERMLDVDERMFNSSRFGIAAFIARDLASPTGAGRQA